MEGIYKELDEVKAEMMKLKAEYQIKIELFESLKRAHNEQLLEYQEAKQQIEKQAQELNSKSEEISEARQIHEDLKSSLHEKEISLRDLSSVNEKLRADCGQKLQKLEGENRELVLALNEVTARSKELEQNACASHKEIEGLKSILMVAERKCFEVEQRAQKAKELRQRDDVILKLEEENRDIQDQLKWKNEQFEHLEEAHKRLQDLFQLSKEEWERGKSALLAEISSLQTSLDSQTRILEGLQTRLEMCNQALALEESRRKFLEVQVSELNSRFNNVFSQRDEENSKIQNLIVQRDEEIARLRNSLGRKETLIKEMEFRMVHLEQENQELGESLKEFREAQIRNAGATSLTKLRNKLRGLEQVHSNCSTNMKAKESELSFQIEKMSKEIDSYKSELEGKEKQIEELQMELESCHSAIEVLKEEIPIVCMVLKSEFSEAYSEIFNAKAEMKLHNKEKEDINPPLTEQLAVNKSYSDIRKENEELTSLRKRVKSLECMLAGKEDELQQNKKMLKESSECQLRLKEQVLQMESALQKAKRDVFEALEKVNLELAEKSREVSRVEYELQNWKSNAESLKASFDENQEICKQMESALIKQAKLELTIKNEKESLLCIVKEREKIIKGLRQEIVSLEARIVAMKEAFKQEKDSILLIAEEKDSFIENLQKDSTFLKQESMRREAEAAVLGKQAAEKAFEQEKGRLLQIKNEKDQRIKDLRELAISLEQDMKSTVISCFQEVIEKQVEIYVLGEAIKNAEYLINVEIEEKNKVIANLETEAYNLRQKLAVEGESLLHSKRQAEQLQELLEAKRFETEKLMDEQRKMEGLVKELDLEKETLLQDSMKLSTERQDLLVYIQEFCDTIGEFSSSEDLKLMKILGRISQNSEEEIGGAMSLMMHSELYDSTRENADPCISGTTKKPEVGGDERSPLKDVNHWQL
jgi:chromosome segregation ATPase